MCDVWCVRVCVCARVVLCNARWYGVVGVCVCGVSMNGKYVFTRLWIVHGNEKKNLIYWKLESHLAAALAFLAARAHKSYIHEKMDKMKPPLKHIIAEKTKKR